MRAVWYRAWAELRRTMASTVLLILVVAISGGVVMATIAGALRGRDALPGFLTFNAAADISAFSYFGALPPDEERRLTADLMAVPGWEVVGNGRPVVVSLHVQDEWSATFATGVIQGPYLTDLDRPILVDGRLPDPQNAEEVVVNEALADAAGVGPGDTLDLRTITPEMLPAVTAGQATTDPDGEPVSMSVTGIVRRPVDLSLDAAARRQLGSDSWYLVLGPAFLERFDGRLASFGVGVEGRATPDHAAEVADALVERGGAGLNVEQGNLSSEIIASAQRAIDFETTALLGFAVVALLTAAVLVGQLLGRRGVLDLTDNEALRGAGMRHRDRAAIPVVRAVMVAVPGAIGAGVLATLASTAFPIGVAGRAELDPGIDVNGAVIVVGMTLVALSVVGRVAVTGLRTAAASTSPTEGTHRVSSLSRASAAFGPPVSAEMGVRMAFHRGRGPTAVPVVGAAAAFTFGVVALTAALVMATSLDRLIASPALQGWTWDLAVGNMQDLDTVAATRASLQDNELVESYLGFSSGTVVIDGQDSYAAAFGRGDPTVGPPAIEGRRPAADDEVALGLQTIAALDKKIGDEVTLTAAPGAPEVEATIVGTVVLPVGLETQLTFGQGAVMTGDGLSALYGDEAWVPNTFVVDLTDGTSLAEGDRSIRQDVGDAVRFNFAPDVQNLRRVQQLPRIFALLVAALGLGTLANALVTSIHRRRRDLATLAALGFRRRQLAGTICWQATTFAAVALVLGIPLGVAAGRTTWRLMMDSIGSVVAPSVPLLLLLVVAIGTLVAANLIAAVPARTAARTRPAEVLQSE